jgi:hypothetical protein
MAPSSIVGFVTLSDRIHTEPRPRLTRTAGRVSPVPSVSLSLPDGRVLTLAEAEAERAAERLWARAEEPGAVVCATVITQALRRPIFGRVEIQHREAAVLSSVLAAP